MALLLSLETSTQSCSAALHDDGVLVSSKVIETPRSAASQLAVMIDEVFQVSNKKPQELKGVIVAAGPGSYTGLRIGVATAKGLCYALNIPIVSVNTLQLMAYQFLETDAVRKYIQDDNVILCPMLDARRMEVYCALLDHKLNYIEEVQAKIMDEESFKDMMESTPIFFFGDGADKCKDILKHPNAHFSSGLIPLASSLGEIGYKKWKAGEYEDLVSFEPFYLKDFLIKKPNLN
ncbi:MAG: tRNA ((37)-N6)-threonylcarbamoyltransferase complex dimerization subunit type 1 TsaB [Bacteroidota bacterium]|jgi:tRNA threonylcarbamoyladenosine biosynthesis protein TsaB